MSIPLGRRSNSRICATVFFLTSALGPLQAAATLYWDPSSGPDGAWDTATASWSVSADGSGSPATWADYAIAAFSAEGIASGAYTATLDGTRIVSGLQFLTGSPTLSGGTVQFGGVNFLDIPPPTIEVADGVTATIASSFISAQLLTKSGTGTLIMLGSSIDGYHMAIDEGTVQFGNGGAITGTGVGVTVNNGSLIVNNSGSTGAGAISGTGSLTKLGPGSLSLLSSSTYTGSTTVSGGTLAIGGTSQFSGDILNNAAVSFAFAGATAIYAGNMSGTGTATFTGSATLLGMNTYSGLTTIGSGNLQIGNGGLAGSIAGDIFSQTSNPALIFNRSDDLTYGSIYSGFGKLTKLGAGTLSLTGANTYSGGTTVSAGTLQLGNGGATGTIAGAVADNAVFAFDRSDTYTFSPVISGSGAVTKLGVGTTILTGANTYAGGTIVSAGILQIGSGSTTGAIIGDVANDATLAFNRSNALTLDGNITGTGALTKAGAGTLTLAGTNTYTGVTTISGGFINFSSASLGTGAITLAGGGLQWAAGNTADISDRLTPLGTGGGKFDTNGNNVTFFSTVGGTGALTKLGAGILTLPPGNTYTGTTTISGGMIEFTDATTFGSGSGKTITLNGGGLKWSPGSTTDISGKISSVGAGGTVFDTNGNDIVFATGFNPSNRAIEKAGAGKLTIAASMSNLDGTTTVSGGTLQIGNGAAAGAFSGNIVLQSGTELVFNHGISTYSQSGTISGAGDVRVIGTNPLFSEASIAVGSYAGPTYVSNADFSVTGSLVSDVELDNGSVTFNLSAASTSTYAGTISGNGSLRKFGTGTLVLAGTNTYSGVTSVSGGGVQFSSIGNFGTGPISISNGGLQWAPGNTTDISGKISSIGSLGAKFDTNGNNVTFATAIAGTTGVSNAFSKLGAGTLTLTADNAFSLGGVLVNAGTLQVGNGGTTGSLSTAQFISTSPGTALVFNRSDATEFAGTLSGGGSITKLGAGTLTLSGANGDLTGPTFVNEGTMRLSGAFDASVLGSSAATVAAGATLTGTGTLLGSVQTNGTYAPGDGVGVITSGSVTFGATGIYQWQLNDAIGSPGTPPAGWDFLAINGTLAFSSGATLSLSTLDAADLPGLAANFDPSASNSWTIATVTGAITGWSLVTIDAAGFENTHDGTFTLGLGGLDSDSLILNYTAVPEPATSLQGALGLLLVVLYALRKRQS